MTITVRPAPVGFLSAIVGGALFLLILGLRTGPSPILVFVGTVYAIGVVVCLLALALMRLQLTPVSLRRRSWFGVWTEHPIAGHTLLVATVQGVSQVTRKPVQRLALLDASGATVTRITSGLWDAAALVQLVSAFGDQRVDVPGVQTAAMLQAQHPGSLSYFARHPYLVLLLLLVAVLVLVTVFAALGARA